MTPSKAAIAILGGRGMLGRDLAAACEKKGWEMAVFDQPEFDIRNPEQLRAVTEKFGVIVNCAAYTNVEKAESETDLAYQINGEAVGRLGQMAKEAGSWVLHVGTDFVFDGTKDGPYDETDPPNPISVYGRSKWMGERLLAESGCRHCRMRVQWTYGAGGTNFVSKLIAAAGKNPVLKVVEDQIGSPTATTEAAKAMCALLEKREEGLFHFASEGYVSRYEMAEFVFRKLGMAVSLVRCKTSEFPCAAARPLNSCFDCRKIKAVLDEAIQPWQVPLEQFLKNV